ncbi:unnamed protein product [Tilletia controversa]|uniref:Peptidase M20 dimerisation domain-containing protein n=1 Tax=Tilletia controversa TaxID=13291 RepID=A0A8X7N274_9BASI|nr:hypothetical protein A4X06_0g25 [Tilletia controversa]CAD6909532.1 unnamed protein product [Tilletia controversa]CAD6936864.1 unnamed protein product [Tilletia controversa]
MDSSATQPALFHSLSHHAASVLALAVDSNANIAYSASQSECIVVWDLATLQERTRLKGHTASVLALELALDKGWLFSSSGDNTVRIWDIHSHLPVAVLYPAEDNVGDIFSLQWSQHLQTLYVGCQNTSIQWISLESVPASAALPVPSKPHKFFDSVPVALQRRRQREEAHSIYAASSSQLGSPSSQDANNNVKEKDSSLSSTVVADSSSSRAVMLSSSADSEISHIHPPSSVSFSSSKSKSIPEEDEDEDEDEDEEEGENVVHLQFSSNCIVPFAHFGYVYALVLFYPDHPPGQPHWPHLRTPSNEHNQSNSPESNNNKQLPILASASGDEHIKLWNCLPDGSLVLRATLHNKDSDAGGILTLAHQPTTLLAGTQAGTIDIWDLETLTTVRTLDAHGGHDVLSLSTLRIGNPEGAGGGAGEYVCFSSGADGGVRRWDAKFGCTAGWRAHEGLSLACVPLVLGREGCVRVITGGSDALVKVWDFPPMNLGSLLPVAGGGASSSFGAVGLGSPAGSPGTAFLRRSASSASITAGLSTQFSYSNLRPSLLSSSFSSSTSIIQQQQQELDILLPALARFVSFRTVSSDEGCREESRQCAHWLKGCLTQMGAETMLVPGAKGRNPLVLATFRANATESQDKVKGARRKKRCLFYGHYDVVDDHSGAEGAGNHQHEHGHGQGQGQGHDGLLRNSRSGASTLGAHPNGSPTSPASPPTPTNPSTPSSEPWILTGRDSYLYGRGASDNKGPTLAVACAAAELLAKRALEMDVVLLVEGEEEVGSVGLEEAVRRARGQIGDIDVILLSNSYWLGEETPCITMGLRGVIHATIEMCGPDKDVHSGVEGGALREPMIDMVRLLSTLSNGDEVLIPQFYDAVRPVSSEERSAFATIAKMERRYGRQPTPTTNTSTNSNTNTSTESLIARWCRPSLSIHRLGVSGSGNSTVIPSKVEAAVSLRIVPDMDAESVGRAFEAHVLGQFATFRSSNRARVRIDHRADWWLGSEKDAYSQALADSIEAEWGEAPVSIREGGSIPAMALLEKELGAPAVHLPMGQSSDNAHLPGERIRLINLQRGRAVVRRFLEALPGI